VKTSEMSVRREPWRGETLSFEEMLHEHYEEGGSPEWILIPGLGEFYWPNLSEQERAYIQGWLDCNRRRDSGGQPDLDDKASAN
jgi:hypothetical protein